MIRFLGLISDVGIVVGVLVSLGWYGLDGIRWIGRRWAR